MRIRSCFFGILLSRLPRGLISDQYSLRDSDWGTMRVTVDFRERFQEKYTAKSMVS